MPPSRLMTSALACRPLTQGSDTPLVGPLTPATTSTLNGDALACGALAVGAGALAHATRKRSMVDARAPILERTPDFNSSRTPLRLRQMGSSRPCAEQGSLSLALSCVDVLADLPRRVDDYRQRPRPVRRPEGSVTEFLPNQDRRDSMGNRLAKDDQNFADPAAHSVPPLRLRVHHRIAVLADAAQALVQVGNNLLSPDHPDDPFRSIRIRAKLAAGLGRDDCDSVLGHCVDAAEHVVGTRP